VRLVVADTGPVNYLILIGHIELLPFLCERVVLPTAVQIELSSPGAPLPVQRWIATPPIWLEIAEPPVVAALRGTHPGEAAAIALAVSLHADLLLMDDRRGVSIAKQQGLRVTGTLGVLDLASDRGLVNFPNAIRTLELTSFRRPEAVLKSLLAKHKDRKET
jgi:predicted nucleic acid-binding protein